MSSHALAFSQNLRAGKPVFSAWCTLAAPLVGDALARAGFAAVTIDQQHGLFDTRTTIDAVAAIHGAGAAPLVRVPVGDFAGASRVLDFGALGVIAPMINSVEDARALVAATKFPPLGARSWGPHRAMALCGIADQADYLRHANLLTLTFAMVETRAALKTLDLILKTRGIDGVFVGPSDLSIALSNGAVLEPQSHDIDRELDRVAKTAKKAGKIAGAYCGSAARARELAERGFTFLAIGSNSGFLRAGAAEALAVIGEAQKSRPGPKAAPRA